MDNHELIASNRALALSVSAAALALALAACSPQGEKVNEALSVADAKAVTQQTERDIVAVIPSEYVAAVDQTPEGVLLSCDDKRGYQWTGSTTIALEGSPDIASIMESVGTAYAERQGYTTRDISEPGDPSVQVIGEYGAGYVVGPWSDGTQIRIFSFSPCFHLPDDQWAGGTY